MSEPGRYLHFSLGPVQGFVSQARRARDLWAGSFLLSWLSGRAMAALQDKGLGRVAFPNIAEDRLFLAIQKKPAPGADHWPLIGSLPNRFKARLEPGADRVGAMCRQAVADAWRGLAVKVWSCFLAPVAHHGQGTETIWNRQISAFWETSWVVADDTSALDSRKNWRAHMPPDEPGDHCVMMGDWQELSGQIRAQARTAQDGFWAALREHIDEHVYRRGPGDGRPRFGTLELRATERLCAIALVKRLFPLLPEVTLHEVFGFVPGARIGTPLKHRPGGLRKWPSTAYMAAAPWLKRAWGENRGACIAYHNALKIQGRTDETLYVLNVAERVPRVNSLRDTAFSHGNETRRFGDLDGALFFDNAIRNDRAELRRHSGVSAAEANEATNTTLKALAALQAAVMPGGTQRQRKFKTASPFYALLLMDGDHVGVLLRSIGEAAVSHALAGFTGAVEAAVKDHDGVTLYAGGDDFLGLFPLTTALEAAAALREAYVGAFRAVTAEPATTSAGLVFAHYSVPLSFVTREAHRLLDEAAKDRNGRDSLAVAVHKPSGKAAEWRSAWTRRAASQPAALVTLGKRFAEDDEQSSSFLYHLRERFGDVFHPDAMAALSEANLKALLKAERLRAKALVTVTDEAARRAAHAAADSDVDHLMRVCCPVSNRDDAADPPFAIDGALIARFLADNGFSVGGVSVGGICVGGVSAGEGHG